MSDPPSQVDWSAYPSSSSSSSSPLNIRVVDRYISTVSLHEQRNKYMTIDKLFIIPAYIALIATGFPVLLSWFTLYFESFPLFSSFSSSASDGDDVNVLNVSAVGFGDDNASSTSYSSPVTEDTLTVLSRMDFSPLLSAPFISALALPALIVLHLFITLAQFWSTPLRAALKYKQIKPPNIRAGTYVCVTPVPHCGAPALCLLMSDVESDSLFFVFQKQKYSIVRENDGGNNLFYFSRSSLPVDLPLSHYANSNGHTEKSLSKAKSIHGLNMFDIPLPLFSELFLEHAMAPLFLFQMFCVLLWCLDEYWYYSILTLVMLVAFETMVVKRRLRSLEEIRSMRVPSFPINVYRDRKWSKVMSDEIVPADIISITRPSSSSTTGRASSNDDAVVPCDVLLLSGSCVVNEALLTGESVPQVKENIGVWMQESSSSSSSSSVTRLALNSDHKRSIVFGGTKVLLSSSSSSSVPCPPDGGATCFVLRTGFNTSQGELVRTILFSTERAGAQNKEAILFIGFLLIFAVLASGYVLIHGLADPLRSRYKLVLNCIMIITSVVPPELPMELSLAVNNSLLELVKQSIYCTEPFRIPLGGSVEVCAFDKTGTITSDNFVVDGIAGVRDENANSNPTVENQFSLVSGSDVSDLSRLVIGGCHSLMLIDGAVIGDPLEKAGLKAIQWTTGAKDQAQGTNKAGQNAKITIRHRYPFSSSLKRMSCVVSYESVGAHSQHVVSKGAAEVMESLFDVSSLPAWYTACHTHFARAGCRVIALGTKLCTASSVSALSRHDAESQLKFAGFLVMRCPIKADSAASIQHLRTSSHKVIMITGDAVLTACHVAKEVSIIGPLTLPSQTPNKKKQKEKGLLILERVRQPRVSSSSSSPSPSSSSSSSPFCLEWSSVDRSISFPYSSSSLSLSSSSSASSASSSIDRLYLDYDLAVTGDAFDDIIHAYDREKSVAGRGDSVSVGGISGAVCDLVKYVSVFARTSPEQKEIVLRAFKHMGYITLMCGDGTNDVGALKQAHVGVALIGVDTIVKATAISQQAAERRRLKLQQQQQQQQQQQRTPNAQAVNAQRAQSSQIPIPNSLAPNKNTKAKSGQLSADERREMMKAEVSARWSELSQDLNSNNGDGGAPTVRLGDASIASPFTSRLPYISSTIDIIRQGRCTLVTTLQMFHILGINCLMSAYSMSVLYLDGVKYGDVQMTVSGLSVAMYFLFLSQARPLSRLSRDRPSSSLFSLHMLLTVFSQFAVHMFVLMTAVSAASVYTPIHSPDRKIEKTFVPTVLNTVVFIISTTTTAATFIANYRGHPFMESLSSNSKLRYALLLSLSLVLLLASELMPDLNELLELSPLPDPEFRSQIQLLIVLDVVATYVIAKIFNNIFKEKGKGSDQ